VYAHPDAHRPDLQCLLCVLRGGDGIADTGEGHEERVSLRVDLDSAMALERLPERPPMLAEYVGVCVAEFREQAGRSLDVGE
jgi:hypothetical protein